MSIYELIDYDSLLDRVGIPHDQEWFCGTNQPENYSYDDVGLSYDDVVNYNGRTLHKPGGLCLSADVNVNGLLLNTRDEHGTLWLCTGIEGWWTLPPSEIPDVPRPYWDGSMLTTGRYLSRTITVTGCFIPPSASMVWYNRDKILRSAGIVRGVGLIATCGNESDQNPEMMPILELDQFHEYTYATETAAPPLTGTFRMSSSSPAATTSIWVHNQDLVDQNRLDTWMGLTIGSLVYVEDISDPTKNALYEMRSLPVRSNSRDYVTLGVRWLKSNGTMTGTCKIGQKAPAEPRVFPNPMYDPAKMAIIQTADTPLVDTVRPNGFTQFSLSFRCAYPTKAAIKEKVQTIPVPPIGVVVGRRYDAFSTEESYGIDETDPANEDTTYTELYETSTAYYGRSYDDVKFFNPDYPIEDEAYDPRRVTGIDPAALVYYNQGNYFAFPTLVMGETVGVSVTTPLILSNDTTGEVMKLVKNIPAGFVLIVDNQARRVTLVNRGNLDTPNQWVWNARDYLALNSEWVSMAAGRNEFMVQKAAEVGFPDSPVQVTKNAPVMYWRDAWIG